MMARIIEGRLSDLQDLSASYTTLPQFPANIATPIPSPPKDDITAKLRSQFHMCSRVKYDNY